MELGAVINITVISLLIIMQIAISLDESRLEETEKENIFQKAA